MNACLPIILVSGFLGAGKTTLMRRLILDAHERGLRAAVVVNEFGAADVDSHILREADAELIAAVAGGCACCTGQNELYETLLEIATRDASARPDVVLLEASGLADPILLLDVISSSHLLPRTRVSALVSVADAARWNELAGALGPLLRRQLQLADWILLNKSDLTDIKVLSNIERVLRDMNPQANLLRTVQCEFNFNALWQHALHNSAQSTLTATPKTHPHEHHHDDHAHAHTVVVRLQHPVERARLEAALQGLGPQVWRAKGFVRLRGASGLQLVQYTGGAHGGRYQIAPFFLPHGDDEPDSFLVFLGASLDEPEIRKLFNESTLSAFL